MDKREVKTSIDLDAIRLLCGEYQKHNYIDPALYDKFDIKRGLRNQDGTGVIAGATKICNVHGYLINEGEKEPVEGELSYRGINVQDIVDNCNREGRFGFEETVYLLLFGELPTQAQLEAFQKVMNECRELPDSFFEDMILKAPSANIMNKLGRSVLALYSYDDEAEDSRLEVEIRKSLQLISRLSNIMVKAYQVKNSHFNGGSLILHPLIYGQSIAESILSLLRPDRAFTKEEALLLDTCMMLHAEHGGGNNSTFTCRVLTSSGTDAYAAYAGAIGSLKGPRHGGANIKTVHMLEQIKAGVKNWNSRDEIADFLRKIVNREAGDGSGLIYGMGHAVYTKSDPRARILKKNAMQLAKGTEFEADFEILQAVEELTPQIFAEMKGSTKVICANVDLYSGLVYKMLNIPEDLFTPIFACSRMAGWSAHRIEEMCTGKRIIRPAYKAVAKKHPYIPLAERG